MKSPDALDYANEELDESTPTEEQRDTFDKLAETYFEYDEYVRIEFDLDKGTAKLLEQ